MANEHTRVVDQQLAYARAQLTLARASESVFSRKACLNACCLHLAEALLAYLRELHVTSSPSIKSASSLHIIFNELRSQSSTDFRVDELTALAFDRQSWLSKLVGLQLFFRKPAGLPERKHQAVDEHQDDRVLIARSSSPSRQELSDEAPVDKPTIDLIANVLDETENLVTRHREFSAEY